jgi:hypothetical protein
MHKVPTEFRWGTFLNRDYLKYEGDETTRVRKILATMIVKIGNPGLGL